MLWIILAVLGVGLVLLLASGDSGTVLGLADGQFAQLIYLGAIALAISSFVLFSGRRLGSTLRGLAAWALILLALVTGYQYRYELQDIANRMTAGLVPASPISMTDADGRAMVSLDKLANGHFEVRATLDGHPVRLLVDTGASTTVLTGADATRIGLDPASLSYTVPVVTANGQASAARTTIGEIAVGSIVRRNVPVLVAQAGLSQSLLGMNFIGTLSGFDMRGDRLILRD